MPDDAQTLPDPTPHRLLTALSECAVDLADLRDPHLVMQALVRRTRALLGTDMAYLSLNDLPRGETHIEVTDGVRTEAYRTIRMPLGTGVLGAVAAGGTDVQTRDYLADPAMNHLPHIDEIVREEGVRAIHGCPIRAGGRVVAALLVAHRSPIRFTRRQVSALRRMAEHAAIALEPSHAGSDDTLLLYADELVERIPLGAQAVCDLLASRLEHPVELYAIDDLVVEPAEPAVLRTALSTSLHTGSPVAVPTADASITVLAIRHRDEHVATVLVPADPLVLGERGRLLLSRSSTSIGAALVAQQRLAEVELRTGTDVFDALLRTDQVGTDLQARLAAHGFSGRRPLTVLVVAVPGQRSTAVMAAVRRSLTPATLLSGDRSGELVVITQVNDAAEVADRLHLALGPGPSLVGWSTTDRGLGGVASAYVTAVRTVAALRALGVRRACADPSRLGPAGLLVAGADERLVEQTIRARLQPLLDADGGRGGRLTETAWVVLECGGRLREAATRLDVHPNTVRQRSERIATLLGPGWRSAPDSLDLHFALRLWRVQGELAAISAESAGVR